VTNAAPAAGDYGAVVRLGDGHSVVEGATADAAVVSDVAGTLSGKLRGLIKWAFERMPASLGQKTMAASLPVVVASDQSAVPVSGPLTDTQLRATAVPVSGTVTASGPLTDTQLRATPVPVSGTVAVTSAGLTNIDVALSTRLKPADTLAGVTTVAAVTAITNALPAGTNRVGSVRLVDSADADLTSVKGTQAARAVGVQDLKDAGRVNIAWTAEFAPAATAEALLTVTESRDGAATTTFTTKVVTSGKRLRITGISIVVENTLGTNPKRAKLRLRFNTAGAVTTASPLQGTWAASVSTAANTLGMPAIEEFTDGMEFLGDGTKQIGFTLEFPDWVSAAQTGKIYMTCTAFEY
jgi:hypothetical protein